MDYFALLRNSYSGHSGCSVIRAANIRTQYSDSNVRRAAKFGAGTPGRHRTANRQKIPIAASRPPLLQQNIPHSIRLRIKQAFDEHHLHH
ncbi:hypothetical protein [Burkholderia anthina]|uniref:hypothetical protein n=1 Tax=Burkholderia anthina TaxID=179879 RepID=UPI001AA05CB9|nr:hypothetical protein [Burkholderia anthina]QTD89115.1 hypothetical protein J4G50_15055 [Burkholderia anthina]